MFGFPNAPVLLADAIPAAFASTVLIYDCLKCLGFKSKTWLLKEFLKPEDFDLQYVQPRPQKLRSSALFALGVTHAAIWIGYSAFRLVTDGFNRTLGLAVIGAIYWALMSARVLIECSATPPYAFMTFSALHITTPLLQIWTSACSPVTPIARVCLSACIIIIGGYYPMQTPLGPTVAAPGSEPTNLLSSPEDSVNLWEWLAFGFFKPMLRLADRQTLNEENVWLLSPYFAHRNIFTKYLAHQKKNPNQTLLRFLLESNSLDLIISTAIPLYKAVAGFIPPYCLQQILAVLESHDPSRRREAYGYGLLVFFVHMSFAQLDVLSGWHSRRCYERARGQLFCALHWKSLKRRDMRGKTGDAGAVESGTEIKGEDDPGAVADIGRVVNLMTGDAYAVAQRFWDFAAVIVAPIRLGIALWFLYSILGWSCFAGVGVVLLAYAVNYPLAMFNVKLTRLSWASRDRRMSYVNEFFQSIRFLKYMGWEGHWGTKVRNARETELRLRVKQNIVDILIFFIWAWIPSAVILVSFLSYTVLEQKELSVSKVFTAIEVFSQLQGPMTEFPQQIFGLLHALVSMKRIEAFLAEDEVEDWASSLKRDSSGVSNVEGCDTVGFEGASFEWHLTTPGSPDSKFELKDLAVIFPTGKLSLITGSTGSGKTSLLNALLGELHRTSGKAFLNKANSNVAYCAQNPWLEHATIRDNITFRTPFDPLRYKAVLKACALERDLAIFAAGDMTEIGEKGVSLSGGQRARVALARAVYSQAKVVLLDDPLAAVDMHTARHLVYECFDGDLMKGRTILLVTHHVSLCLPATSYLLELENGRIHRKGTLEELQMQNQLANVITQQDDTKRAELQEEVEAIRHTIDRNDADPSEGSVTPMGLDQTTDTSEDALGELSKPSGKLIDDEKRAEGRVSLRTYLTYARAAGWPSWVATLLLILTLRGIVVGNQFFLAWWAQSYNNTSADATTTHPIRQWALQWSDIMEAPSTYRSSRSLLDLPSPQVDVKPWLIIFTLISLSSAFCTLTYYAIGYWTSLTASRGLFISLLNRVSRAPTSFFDKTPIGRILNRFTTDIGTVDGALFLSARSALSGTVAFLASFGVIVFVIPQFGPAALAIAFIYIKLAPPYVKASRDLRRLESVSLSPAFSGFDELLQGLPHIRAFGVEYKFQERFYTIVDKFQGFDHFYWIASGWLKYRYDVLGSLIVYLTTVFALASGVGEGMAAVVIVNAGVFAEASRQLVKVFAQLELDFNSVERIVEYLDVEQEAPSKVDPPPPAYWPSSNGGIVIEDLVIRYSPTLPPVLKGISFDIKPREKVGVVGRTGSGKSTLALSLLRIIEPSHGRILLDGIDVATVGLDDLRGSMTIVSQDVALFAGTVRSNLDPFGVHTDAECWDVLKRCHLVSGILPSPPSGSNNQGSTATDVTDELVRSPHRRTAVKSLSQAVSPGGSSFSAGERQLLALSRAMLRSAKFTILDEASSSIDLETDDKIQRTIREEMADCMVLTIAHRLKTVIDYDRILVLDDGKVAEYDTPMSLFDKPGGLFRSMCEKSADWEELLSEVAKRR